MEKNSNSIFVEKKKIRSAVLKIRNAMTEEERCKASENVLKKIISSDIFAESDIILCFVSYGTEINTYPFIEFCLGNHKRVFVPKVISNVRSTMQFYEINDITELTPGYKGIPEPSGNSILYEAEADVSKTMLVMPGSAFDADNHRMGYGKGFYDRFLAKHTALQQRSVAIGFACQMVECVPCEDTDIQPAMVLVNDEYISCD